MKQSVPAILFFLGIHPLANAQVPVPEPVKSAMPGSGKPNVIIILSDDQGVGDFSCHGNPVLKTPALDKLYNESVHFGNFHVAPLCTPSRSQLMTGLDAMRNGAATVLTGRNLMHRELITMPEVFRNNGYATGIFGKWHLGDIFPDRPMDRGFEKCIWHKGWGLLSETEFDNDYYETRYLDSLETRQSGEYCTNLWFNKAMEWMDETAGKNQPFFTYLALNAPHGPFDSPAQDYLYYRNQVKDSLTACFLGMIRNIDRNMARLDRWLEDSGLKDNTLLVYMNDNGGTGGTELYNAGLRDKKGSVYEGGHRAACFVRWPEGNLSGSGTISTPAQIQDLFPTFIELLELDAPENIPFDGKSLVPLLRHHKPFEDRMFVVQYGGHVQPEKYFSCVVWNNWRLVGDGELYDISADPGQKSNIAVHFPEVAERMRAFYENWWKGIEPGLQTIVPVVVGSEDENPAIFTSNNWVDDAVNTQWKVAQAAGNPKGGICHIQVVSGGKFRVELSRWPFHLERSLQVAGPETSVGGAWIRPGKALPVHDGCVVVDQGVPVVSDCTPGATKITFEMDLPAGDHTFRAWFRNRKGVDLCGAYYVRMERLH